MIRQNTQNAKDMNEKSNKSIKGADETWIATALLHRENPDRTDFTISEIVKRAERENIYGELRPGIRVHATLHCVANRPPNPGRYRMLFATGKSTRRLFRPGDPSDRARDGGKVTPEREDVPTEFRGLIDWYYSEYTTNARGRDAKNSILGLRGLGKEIWQGEDADTYVRRLREGWE
jgi:hypothetical protein